MHRSRHATSPTSAAALLTVFLVGGLLGPAVHRAYHGLTWAKLHAETAASCDHAQHGDSFEVSLSNLLDDECLLCVRHLVYYDGARSSLSAYHDYSGFAAPVQSALEPLPFTVHPIRGPPLAS